jgi:hypothetical protein
MKLLPKPIFVVILLMFCFFQSQAQATYTPSHLKAAERMLIASGIQENLQKTFSTVIVQQSVQIPEEKRATFIKVMNDFIAKYITWDEVKSAFIPIYASEFTEDELNKISDFLSTPAGKKMSAVQPELVKKGGEWGQSIVTKHQADLEAMMKQAFGEK